jgi:hypothetical protein
MADLDAALRQFEATESNLENWRGCGLKLKPISGVGLRSEVHQNTTNSVSRFARFCPLYLPLMDSDFKISFTTTTQ